MEVVQVLKKQLNDQQPDFSLKELLSVTEGRQEGVGVVVEGWGSQQDKLKRKAVS